MGCDATLIWSHTVKKKYTIVSSALLHARCTAINLQMCKAQKKNNNKSFVSLPMGGCKFNVVCDDFFIYFLNNESVEYFTRDFNSKVIEDQVDVQMK